MTTTIAHLTDVHLGPVAGFAAPLLEPEAGPRLSQLGAQAAPRPSPGGARPHRRRHGRAAARPHRGHRRSRQHRPAAGAHQRAGVAQGPRCARARHRGARQPRHLLPDRPRSRHAPVGGLHDLRRRGSRLCRRERRRPAVRAGDRRRGPDRRQFRRADPAAGGLGPGRGRGSAPASPTSWSGCAAGVCSGWSSSIIRPCRARPMPRAACATRRTWRPCFGRAAPSW